MEQKPKQKPSSKPDKYAPFRGYPWFGDWGRAKTRMRQLESQAILSTAANEELALAVDYLAVNGMIPLEDQGFFFHDK